MRAKHRPVRQRNPTRQAVDAAAVMRERSGIKLGTCMRWVVVAGILGVMASGAIDVAAAPASRNASAATGLSAQAQRPPTRFRVYPGRLLYRDCTFRLAYQWRPSGTVIVPVQRCWWVRG
jgi:hypothetical protein